MRANSFGATTLAAAGREAGREKIDPLSKGASHLSMCSVQISPACLCLARDYSDSRESRIIIPLSGMHATFDPVLIVAPARMATQLNESPPCARKPNGG